uniref:Uncharacterized protein n=1 Tax=Setaria italica TaxID=4555 RepID=K4A3S7_SETIT
MCTDQMPLNQKKIMRNGSSCYGMACKNRLILHFSRGSACKYQ